MNLLRLGVMKFSSLMREITSQDGNEIDPMIDLTLASFCMRTFKTNFLEEKWLYSFKDGSTEPVTKLGGTLTLPLGEQLNPDDPNITSKQFLESPIAFLPPDVVDDSQNFSNVSIEWLRYMEYKYNILIQSAVRNGEVKFPKGGGKYYYADGYHEASKTIFEFNGCAFHGCITCYPDQSVKHTFFKQTMQSRRLATEKKVQFF